MQVQVQVQARQSRTRPEREAEDQVTARERIARHDDGGQVAMGLVTCGLLALAALLMLFIVPVSAATDQSNRAQTAADAAALALAKGVIVAADSTLAVVLTGGDTAFKSQVATLGGLAMPAAAAYAKQNGATLYYWRYDWKRDKVTVRVRMDDDLPDSSQRAEAEASAEVGLDWDDCGFAENESSPPPTPPGVMPDVLECGSDSFAYLFYSTGSRTAVNPVRFTALLEPRLVD